MNRDEIRCSHQFFEADRTHADRFERRRWQDRIEGNRWFHSKAVKQFDQTATDATQPNHTQSAITEFAAHVVCAFIPLAGSYQSILCHQLMSQRQHPRNRCFGHRPIHSTGRDHGENVVSRARGDINAVVAYSKATDRQKILTVCQAGFGHTRSQDNRTILAMQLVRRNLRPMLLKLRNGHMIVTVKDTKSEVCKSWVPSGIVKVSGKCNMKGRTV